MQGFGFVWGGGSHLVTPSGESPPENPPGRFKNFLSLGVTLKIPPPENF